MKARFIAAVAAGSVLLGGCGGGDNIQASPDSPVGLWTGSTSNGRAQTVLVLSDGRYYGMYSSQSSASTIAGFVQGTIHYNNQTFASNDVRDFNFEGLGPLMATANGLFNAKGRIQGSVNYIGGGVVNGTGAYMPQFDQTPTTATLAGTYTGTTSASVAFSVQPATVTVDAAGNFAGNANGCVFTGTATPRTEGNAYDVSVTSGGAPCALPNQTVTGAAVYDAQSHQLVAAATNSNRTDGMLFAGVKP
jgi:hypothetical protein